MSRSKNVAPVIPTSATLEELALAGASQAVAPYIDGPLTDIDAIAAAIKSSFDDRARFWAAVVAYRLRDEYPTLLPDDVSWEDWIEEITGKTKETVRIYYEVAITPYLCEAYLDESLSINDANIVLKQRRKLGVLANEPTTAKRLLPIIECAKTARATGKKVDVAEAIQACGNAESERLRRGG